jgi:hypothetical protein
MPIKTLRVCAKTVDRCAITFLNEKGESVGERDCYVPNYFPEDHYGDYLELDIDVETGQILNWVKPTQKELKQSIQTMY